MKPGYQLLGSLLALMLCLTILQGGSIDLAVQRLFFLPDAGRWLWPKHEPILRFVLYDGIKVVLALFILAMLGLLIASRWVDRLRPYRQGLRLVVLAMIVVPLTVASLKAVTNVACPSKLVPFGGDLPYLGLLQHFVGTIPYSGQRCFPAAHASGGFALLGLAFLFRTSRNRVRGLVFALVVGWSMGLYKMAIGDHFLSDTIASMLIAWALVNGLYLLDCRMFSSQSNVRTARAQ